MELRKTRREKEEHEQWAEQETGLTEFCWLNKVHNEARDWGWDRIMKSLERPANKDWLYFVKNQRIMEGGQTGVKQNHKKWCFKLINPAAEYQMVWIVKISNGRLWQKPKWNSTYKGPHVSSAWQGLNSRREGGMSQLFLLTRRGSTGEKVCKKRGELQSGTYWWQSPYMNSDVWSLKPSSLSSISHCLS